MLAGGTLASDTMPVHERLLQLSPIARLLQLGRHRSTATAWCPRRPALPVPAAAPFCYPEVVKSSVSIVLFFLLSGFFLAILLGAIEHSRKLLGIAAGCLAAVVCIIVFLTPVELPSWHFGLGGDNNETETSSPVSASSTTSIAPRTTEPPTVTGSTSTTLQRTVTTEEIGG
jgi:hypothetical protein